MNPRLVRLIIEVLEREKRRYACEAHIEERYHVENPMHQKALKHYQDLERAIAELKQITDYPPG